MYPPPAYRAQHPRALAVRYPFAQLLTHNKSGISATAVPIVFETDEEDETHMVGHLSRNNPHAATLEDGQDVLAIFQGPHAYISPSWYTARPSVPTWNYVAAQVRGTLNVFDDDNTQTAFLARLISVMESGGHWSITDAPEGLITRLMPMIRSFRIKVRTIEGITKLSQPTPMEDRHNVINALEHRDHDQDRSVAAWMRALSINS